jgi:hypothetical protein
VIGSEVLTAVVMNVYSVLQFVESQLISLAENVARIVRAETYAEQESSVEQQGELCVVLIYCMVYYSTLRKWATYSSETSVDVRRTTRIISQLECRLMQT